MTPKCHDAVTMIVSVESLSIEERETYLYRCDRVEINDCESMRPRER